MTVATFVQPDRTTQSGAAYPANIDAATSVMAERAAQLAVNAQSTPNMTVRVRAGRLLPFGISVDVLDQNTGTIVAPTTNPRIDLVVVHAVTGAVSVLTGTEAASPAPPYMPVGYLPLARIALIVGTAAITNSIITDVRPLSSNPSLNCKVAAFSDQNVNVSSDDNGKLIILSSNTATRTVTMPDQAKLLPGFSVRISDLTGAFNATVQRFSGNTCVFYGDTEAFSVTSFATKGNGDLIELVFDGTNWITNFRNRVTKSYVDGKAINSAAFSFSLSCDMNGVVNGGGITSLSSGALESINVGDIILVRGVSVSQVTATAGQFFRTALHNDGTASFAAVQGTGSLAGHDVHQVTTGPSSYDPHSYTATLRCTAAGTLGFKQRVLNKTGVTGVNTVTYEYSVVRLR